MALLLLLAFSWFFRDFFATSLEQDSIELQAAMSERDAQEAAEAQAADQREILSTLARIELRQQAQNAELTPDQIDEEAAKIWLRSVAQEAESLRLGAERLLKLLPHVSLPEQSKSAVRAVAAKATALSAKLQQPAEGQEPDGLMEEWYQIEQELATEYQRVAEQAESDRDSSSSAASFFRMLAWFCTGVGALATGGWSSLLGGGQPADGENAASAAV